LVESFKSTLDEVRESDLLVHVVDISNPKFEEQIEIVNKTIIELGVTDKPILIVFNKIDAYTFTPKEEDDLTPILPENISIEELQKTWMAKLDDESIFISALNKTHFNELKDLLYAKIKQLHEVRYPYNNFLY